jgi:hypothetical protein
MDKHFLHLIFLANLNSSKKLAHHLICWSAQNIESFKSFLHKRIKEKWTSQESK